MAIQLVDLPAFAVVGLPAKGRFEELVTRVPAAWRRLFAAATDIAAGRSVDFLDVSFPPRDGLHHEFVGIRIDVHTPTPAGLARITLPAGRFLTLTHTGALADLAASFEALHRHAAARGLAVNGLKLDSGYDAALSDRPHQLFLAVASPSMDAFVSGDAMSAVPSR